MADFPAGLHQRPIGRRLRHRPRDVRERGAPAITQIKTGKISRRALFAGLVFVFILFGYRCWYPTEPYFDEVYHVKAAQTLMKGQFPIDRHPPVWHIVTAINMFFFGDYPPVWRLFPLVSGVVLVWLIFLLTRRITGDELAAFLAAAVVTFDGLTMVLSRVAMLNVPMLLFMLASFYFYLDRSLIDPKKRASAFRMSGLFLGLAMATRWYGSFAAVLIGACLLNDLRESPREERLGLVRDGFLFYFLLPVAVYFGSYLIVPFLKGKTFEDIWKIQVSDYLYHARLVSKHRYGSEWYSWPYMTRPLWFHFRGTKEAVTAIHTAVNPAVIAMSAPVMLFSAVSALRYKSRAAALVLAGFLAFWLPYCFIGRIQYFHYFHTALPFVAIGLGMGLANLWRSGVLGRIVVGAYAVLLLGLFAFWYPMQTAHMVPRSFYKKHIWAKTWI